MAKATMDAIVSTNGDGQLVAKIEPVKHEISPEDFLLIFAEETIEYPMSNGAYAVLRSLTTPEALQLFNEYKGREQSMAIGALKLSLKAPVLTPEQWAVVETGKAGPLFKIGKFVLELSGMADSESALKNDGASS